VGIDYSSVVYLPVYDLLARPVTFTPSASQPGQAAFAARGIFRTNDQPVVAEDGSVVSDQKTLLYIRDREFSVLPAQGDVVDIGVDGNAEARGQFEISDRSTNSGGETTLTLKALV
jgi:hypothetical protein